MTECRSPSNGGEILSYYEGFDEANRLSKGAGILEFARMQEIINRFLPMPPGVILDVGGGPGKYSCWLARCGFQVHLIDPVEKHVNQAREESASQPDFALVSATLGDARSLNHRDGIADAVLLMGPLYHLTVQDQRLIALREARRVLRPGGLLFATAINRFASLIDGLFYGYIDEPSFVDVLHRDLEDGQHRDTEDGADHFTTAYLHRPEELEAEIRDAGFEQKGLYMVQGPGWLTADLETRMSDPEKKALLLNLIRSVEQEKSLLGMSSHFVIVATR